MSFEPVGLLAEFTTPEALREAARAGAARGFARMEAYTPFPVEGLARDLRLARSRLPLVFLLGGLAGGLGGYFMQWYAMGIYYPLNIGGRPLHSWPSFIPVTFELTVLISALSGVLGLLIALRLPRPHHPLFDVPGFERATVDRFFLSIEGLDSEASVMDARRFLQSRQPVQIVEVPR